MKHGPGKTKLPIDKMNVCKTVLPLDENSREDRPDQATEHLNHEHPTDVRHRASGLTTQIEQRRAQKGYAHSETPEGSAAHDRLMPVSQEQVPESGDWTSGWSVRLSMVAIADRNGHWYVTFISVQCV